jgi:hypothetical protein
MPVPPPHPPTHAPRAPQDRGAIQAAKQRAEELGARVEYASKHDLNMVADNRPHQVGASAGRPNVVNGWPPTRCVWLAAQAL